MDYLSLNLNEMVIKWKERPVRSALCLGAALCWAILVINKKIEVINKCSFITFFPCNFVKFLLFTGDDWLLKALQYPTYVKSFLGE
jgi:hypothetical protein